MSDIVVVAVSSESDLQGLFRDLNRKVKLFYGRGYRPLGNAQFQSAHPRTNVITITMVKEESL